MAKMALMNAYQTFRKTAEEYLDIRTEDNCRLFSQIAELALAQWAAGPLARLAALKARDRRDNPHGRPGGRQRG